jgi:hypothetical protein
MDILEELIASIFRFEVLNPKYEGSNVYSKQLLPLSSVHGMATQNASVVIFTAVRTSNLRVFHLFRYSERRKSFK